MMLNLSCHYPIKFGV